VFSAHLTKKSNKTTLHVHSLHNLPMEVDSVLLIVYRSLLLWVECVVSGFFAFAVFVK